MDCKMVAWLVEHLVESMADYLVESMDHLMVGRLVEPLVSKWDEY